MNIDETKLIQRVALFAFLLNLLLAALKLVLAVISDSIAISAGVIDSITDSIGSLTVYVGIRLSSRKTTRFPLGLYKLENVLSVVISLFIFISGYEIGRSVFFQDPSAQPDISILTLVVLGLTTLSVFAFGRYALIHGRRTGSPVLIAEGKHRQSDVLVSVVILLSSVLSYLDIGLSFGWWSPDRIGALIVIGFVVYTGWHLLSDGMRVLLDASLDPETYRQVFDLVRADPRVEEIKELVGRTAGRFLFLQATITTKETDLKRAHDLSESLERAIKNLNPHVERVTIHIEPLKKAVEVIAIPVGSDGRSVASGFSNAHMVRLYEHDTVGKTVRLVSEYENPALGEERGKGLKIAEWLVEHNVDVAIQRLPVRHKGFFYALDSSGVNIIIAEHSSAEEALDEIMENKRRR